MFPYSQTLQWFYAMLIRKTLTRLLSGTRGMMPRG